MNLEEINREVIAIMKRHYGDRLAKIVLFGSYARGDFDEESDIDYLIVLKDSEVSTPREIHQLSPLMNDLSTERSIHVSAIPVAYEHLFSSRKPFYREVRKDGKTLFE